MATSDEAGVLDGPPHQRYQLSPVGRHLVAASGEFVGTFFFLYFGYAGNLMAVLQAPYTAPNGGLASSTDIWIAVSYGFALFWFLWVLGSICAGGLVDAMFPGKVEQANTLLGPNTSIARGVFLEMFFTAQLVFVVLMLAAEKSRDTFLAPIGIGLALFVALIPGVSVTGGSANPVRSFGCAVAGASFPGYHWIYWVGPALGATLAALYYRLVKRMHYEEANPGQDSPHEV
ncbi:hypothetical protein CDV36_009968 [Fusarium kuroshium]|uniref:Aquaporin-1 n=1 Tax=Fusarium kuroshium TaxID=2010991 RepID=A0A3M2RYN8_9HYPO|nr:hypothetical protein CDV36_009968 [Fusarium kuroshium]